MSGIGSIERGRTALHLNGGVTLGGIARELSYGGAITLATTDHVTMIGEVIGRRLDAVGRIVSSSAPTSGLTGQAREDLGCRFG